MQTRDPIGTGANATEDLALEQRQRLRERQVGTSWARVVLGIVRGVIVMVGDSDGRVVDRMAVESVLPGKPISQSVAVPHLVGVPDDRASLAAIDPLGDVEQRVRCGIVVEVAAPPADLAL